MTKIALKYGTGLIALYIVTANASRFGTVISAGAKGGVSTIKAFQGR